MDPSSFIDRILEIVDKQEKWRGSETINLIASENVMSPLARKTLSSDFWHRYAEGTVGKRGYEGTRFVDEMEQMCIDLFKDVFNAKNADVRPISGAIANLAVYYALTKPGDTIMSLSVPTGAHISYTEFGSAGCRGLKVLHIPFNAEEMNIDLEGFSEVASKAKPKLIMLGGSVFLFPAPIADVKKLTEELGSTLVYDGAHVMGLIAGKSFQDPLGEGAHILSGSTHKTLPGPQGGVILTNHDELFTRLKKAIFPGLISNHHLHRLPALAITLLEMKRFGKEYATQIIRNAKSLGKALHESGFEVICPNKDFTESHQVLLDVSKIGGGKKAAELLEKCNIITNKNLLPKDMIEKANDPSGLRLGTQEVTRIKMREPDMKFIADLMKRALIDGENLDEIKKEVISFRKNFLEVGFTFPQNVL